MRIPALLRCALAVLFASALPLLAQLNPKHQDPGNTDLLDVYQAGGARPELITTFDQSGSMSAVYFDSRYYPNVSQNWHNNRLFDRKTTNGTTNGIKEVNNFVGDDDHVVPVVKITGTAGTISFAVSIDWMHGSGDYKDIDCPEIVATGVLIKPDGSPVTQAEGGNSSAYQWVIKASHVRTTCVDTKGTAVLTDDDTRTVDLPIPWAVFDPVMGATEASTNATLKTVAGMPKLMRIHDAVPTTPAYAQDYLVETLYQTQATPTGANYILNEAVTAGAPNATGRQKIGRFAYNTDFFWWIFFGKDVRVDRFSDNTGTLQGGNAKPYTGSNKGGFTVPGSDNCLVAGVNQGSDGVLAWNNGLSGMTRIQALKFAVLSTYVDAQDDVWWAYRFFARCSESGAEEGNASTYNSTNNLGAATTRALTLMKKPTSATAPHASITTLQAMQATGTTPLTYALMNTYAQMASRDTSATSIFGNANTETPIPACRNSYVAIFTDGIANDRYNCSSQGVGSGDVYGTGADAGNVAISTQLNSLKPNNPYFNVWTMAAVAAHYPYTNTVPPAGPTDSAAIAANRVNLPWAVTTRGAGQSPGTERRIRTMSVGMALAGDITDAAGGQGALYLTALYGNPRAPIFNKASLTPPYDPSDPNRQDRDKNPFFFSATDANKLVNALQTIVKEVKIASSTLSAPTTPLVGFSLGKQVYVGTFTTAESVIWKGDLLMSGLLASAGKVAFLDKTGAETASLNASTAVWSASNSLQAMGWKPRVLKTSRPASPTTLINFDQNVLTKAETGCSALTDAQFWQQIRYIKGAGPTDQLVNSSSDAGCANIERSDIMGDIINSTPAVLEFDLSKAPSGLDPGTIATEKKFRVIFVGDNQGWFHAFGEISGLNSSKVLVGAVKELWAYFPSELLPHVGLYRDSSYGHRYGFDGSPIVYFDDKPSGSSNAGDGVVSGTDVVRVIVGLGKGGRGYYCFTFTGNDPSTPALSWVRIPDENAGADKTLAENLVGWSTAKPGLATVKNGSTNTDVVFLGGGLSTTTGLEDSSNLGTLYGGAKLGRKILCLDVLTGAKLKSWDTVAFSGAGSIARGVLPYEFFPNSGQAQRVYFSDMGGNVFALGQPYVSGTFRGDTSDITSWGLRRIFQSPAGTPISSIPAAFRVKDGFPVARSADPKIKPPIVGLAFGQGDRNDPMDLDPTNPTPGGATAMNRMVVVFDRQDSASVSHGLSFSGKDFDTTGMQIGDLADLSTVTSSADLRLDPIDASYYLNQKLGYYLNMPAATAKVAPATGWFYPKVVTESRVLDGVLFFSMFKPLPPQGAGLCEGAGKTYTFRECDVFAPVWNNGNVDTNADATFTVNNDADSKCSGVVSTFQNIGGDIANVGTTGVLQAGQASTPTGQDEEIFGSSGTISTQGASGNPGTYGQRPRAWRIIR
ncbi:MAG: hypothetical protein IPL96_14575 [Holophagaceae bacterium]|nr:hypothetical protein [Holophagaceae bacterium]